MRDGYDLASDKRPMNPWNGVSNPTLSEFVRVCFERKLFDRLEASRFSTAIEYFQTVLSLNEETPAAARAQHLALCQEALWEVGELLARPVREARMIGTEVDNSRVEALVVSPGDGVAAFDVPEGRPAAPGLALVVGGDLANAPAPAAPRSRVPVPTLGQAAGGGFLMTSLDCLDECGLSAESDGGASDSGF